MTPNDPKEKMQQKKTRKLFVVHDDEYDTRLANKFPS